MRIINNTPVIKRRNKISQIANLLGIVMLGAGLVISLTKPEWALYTLVLLLLGVILSQYGIAMAYRYARKPRPDEELANALKGLDNRYRLYNFILPANHLLLTPRQVYVIVLKGIAGKVVAEERRWQQDRKFSLGRLLRVFNPEGLGNPVREAEWDRDAVREWVRHHAGGLDIEVEPLVVFLHPNVDLELKNPAVPAVRARNLKDFLRKGEGATFPSEHYQQLVEAFAEASPAAAGETTSDVESEKQKDKKGR